MIDVGNEVNPLNILPMGMGAHHPLCVDSHNKTCGDGDATLLLSSTNHTAERAEAAADLTWPTLSAGMIRTGPS